MRLSREKVESILKEMTLDRYIDELSNKGFSLYVDSKEKRHYNFMVFIYESRKEISLYIWATFKGDRSIESLKRASCFLEKLEFLKDFDVYVFRDKLSFSFEIDRKISFDEFESLKKEIA